MVWTASKLAQETGFTRQHITRLLRSGKLKGEKLSSGWIISDEEAKKLLEEQREKQPPPQAG